MIRTNDQIELTEPGLTIIDLHTGHTTHDILNEKCISMGVMESTNLFRLWTPIKELNDAALSIVKKMVKNKNQLMQHEKMIDLHRRSLKKFYCQMAIHR